MEQKGIITVEASVVLTVTIFITFWIVFMACYLGDMVRINELLAEESEQILLEHFQCMDAQNGEIDWEEWGKRSLLYPLNVDYSSKECDVQEKVEKKIQEMMWFHNSLSVKAEISHSKVKWNYEGYYHFPINGIWQGKTGEKGIHVIGEREFQKTDTLKFVRMIRGILME